MPMFHYQCKKCEGEVEVVQKAAEPLPEEECEKGGACEFTVLPWFARAQTGPSHKFKTPTEGIGGWERQGKLLVRKVKGLNTTRYGEGSI